MIPMVSMHFMLTAISTTNKTQVIAIFTNRDRGPFVCPNCRRPVSLRKGTHNLAHFAHKRPITCDYGKGESPLHRRCKLEIFHYLKLHPSVTSVELEFQLGTVRPDVFAYIRGVPVAIEVQLSTLSPEKISARTVEYTKRGIYVLWLMQWTPKLRATRYSPRRFERWLHAAYFGRVYFWIEDLTVIPYQFRDHLVHVDKFSWRDRTGKTLTGGGYHRHSKRFRTAIPGTPLHLVDDFTVTTRLPWSSKTLTVPRAHLFMDRRFQFPGTPHQQSPDSTKHKQMKPNR